MLSLSTLSGRVSVSAHWWVCSTRKSCKRKKKRGIKTWKFEKTERRRPSRFFILELPSLFSCQSSQEIIFTVEDVQTLPKSVHRFSILEKRFPILWDIHHSICPHTRVQHLKSVISCGVGYHQKRSTSPVSNSIPDLTARFQYWRKASQGELRSTKISASTRRGGLDCGYHIV